MQINWGIVVSIVSMLITIYTIVRTNAKSEEKMQGEIAVIKNDVKHLAEKVDKHNGVIDRTYKLEEANAVLEQQMKVEQHRMDDAEADIKKINDRMTRRNAV